MSALSRISSLFAIALCALTGRAQDTLLTLDRAIEVALQNNFDIRIARNMREQAENLSTAGNANMLPRLDLNGAYTRTTGDAKQELSNGSEVDRSNATSDNANANVALTWTIFDGTRMFATREKLKQLAAQGDQTLKVQLESTTVDVITMYYAVVQQQQLLRSLGRQIAVAEEIVTISDRKLANGSGSRLDLLLARTELNALRSEQLTTQSALDQAKVGLRNLLAMEASMGYSVEDTVIITYDPPLEQLKTEARANNNLLRFYDREQRIAELGVKEYKAMHWPVIDLIGAYQFTRTTNNASFILLNQNLGYSYGVTATVPLFNGFKLDSQVKNAKLGLVNAQLEYDKATHQVSADVLAAYQDLQAAKGVLQLEEENITAARELLDIARERYRVGASNIIELKDAQATYGQSVRRLAGARNAAKLAETRLRQLAGALVR
jgi:outer membrane protein